MTFTNLIQGGITALHIASYKNMMDTVKLLLSAKQAANGLVDAQDDVSPCKWVGV